MLRTKASRPSVYGVAIACIAVVVATMLVAYMQGNALTLEALIEAQRSNFALWILDLMPFAFALWGHYVGSLVAREATKYLVTRQAQALRRREVLLQSELAHHRRHDALTGLANRMLMIETLKEAIQAADSAGESVGLFVVDVVGFRGINSVVGHEHGDKLLKSIASQLQSLLPPSYVSARLSGDEFAVLQPHVHDEKDLEQTADIILSIFARPLSIGGISLMIEIGLGASLYPADADNADAMMQRAYMALYVSKERQQGLVRYRPEMEGYSLATVMLKAEIRQAIEDNDFFLTFQPKVNRHNHVEEAEVLLRWQHPQRGELLPSEFIPYVEKCKMNHELLAWLLMHAVKQAVAWMQAGIDIVLAVNLSALDLGDPELPAMIARILQEHELPPERLKLEITESTVMEDQEQALAVLNGIAALGVYLSIDDFGTGFSSLSYLSRLPVHELKLDQSFVMTMLEDERNALIVQAIVDLAHQLKLRVVAEGIEDKDIMKAIRHTGCDMLQGYYISKPMTAEAFERWYGRWQEKRQQIYLR